MLNQFSRTQLLLGEDGMKKLADSRVAVFGIGGVGGFTVEALVRSGVGSIDVIDDDKICLTNLNRQIIATRDTVGQYKVDVAEERIKQINPNCTVTKFKSFYSADTADTFPFDEYDYVVDAIDTVSAKLTMAEQAKAHNTPIISSMGAGNNQSCHRRYKCGTAWHLTTLCALACSIRRTYTMVLTADRHIINGSHCRLLAVNYL